MGLPLSYESRRVRAVAKNQIKKGRNFVLISISGDSDRVDVVSDTRSLDRFKAFDPLRIHFNKLADDLAKGSVNINLLHRSFLRREEENEKVRIAKEERSLKLQGGV